MEAKSIISGHILLTSFDMDRKTVIQSDGSKSGMGYVLYQIDTNNAHYIIQVGSCATRERQKLYSPIELESISLRFALVITILDDAQSLP